MAFSTDLRPAKFADFECIPLFDEPEQYVAMENCLRCRHPLRYRPPQFGSAGRLARFGREHWYCEECRSYWMPANDYPRQRNGSFIDAKGRVFRDR